MEENVTILTQDFKESYGSTRNWVAVLYPENMIPDWQNKIYRLLQVPFCYVIHDKDVIEDFDDRMVVFDTDENGHKILDSERVLYDNSGKRKTHVHLIIHYANTTTYKSALDLFKSLSALGKRCCNTCQPVRSLEKMWHYLIHNTPECIKENKFLYSAESRICGNNWDLGSFIALEHATSMTLLMQVEQYIKKHRLFHFGKVSDEAMKGTFDAWFKKEDCPVTPYEFCKNNRNYLSEICKGVYFDYMFAKEEEKKKEKENKSLSQEKKIIAKIRNSKKN